MASSLLAQIASPTLANPAQAFIAGREAGTQRNLLQQQVLGTELANQASATALTPEALALQRAKTMEQQSLLEQQAIGQGLSNQAAQVGLDEGALEAKRKEIGVGLLNAQSAGAGETRTMILQSMLNDPNLEEQGRGLITNLLNTPSEQQDTALASMISGFTQAGYIEDTSTGGKTPEQIQQALDIESGTLAAREAELAERIRARETGSDTGTVTLSSLGKLMRERDALNPETNADDIAAYNAVIDGMMNDATDADIQAQADNLAIQVVQGRLDPNTISKRGGLQQTVYSTIEENYPGTNLAQLSANVKFWSNASNLQSRGLIGGVQPLFDSLLETGKELDNTSIKVLNRVVNFAKEQTGDPGIVAFNNLRDDVIAESERILMGSGVLSDTKYIRALGNVNSAQSYKQLEAAIAQLENVIRARLHALDEAPFQEASPSASAADKIVADKAAVAARATQTADPLGIR